MARQSQAGYYQGEQFFPVDNLTTLHYFYNGQWYDTETDFDLSENPEVVPVAYNSATGETRNLQGCKIGYMHQGIFYRSRKMVPSMPCNNILHICSNCHSRTSFALSYVNKKWCIVCLQVMLVSGEYVFGTGGDAKEWSLQMIYEIYEAAKNLPPAEVARIPPDKRKLPATCPFPPSYFICVGKDEPTKPDYPPYGHFSGVANNAMEDGCPEKSHPYCKSCADRLTNCRYCGQFIRYEEPIKVLPNCPTHCPSFKIPCCICGQVSKRRKHPPS